MTDDIQTAIEDVTRTAVTVAIRANDPLPYFDEYDRAEDAAEQVAA